MQKELTDAYEASAGALVDYFAKGYTLGPLLGNSQEAQEAVYTVAYRLYNQAKYEPAERLFTFLLLNDHLDRRYYLGYAACAQMQRDHERALRYYGMAHVLDKADPSAPMHMAECLMAQGELEKARTMLSYGLIQARHHAEHHAQVPRLEALLTALDRAESTEATPAGGAANPSDTTNPEGSTP